VSYAISVSLIVVGLVALALGWLGMFLRPLIGDDASFVLCALAIGGLGGFPLTALAAWRRAAIHKSFTDRLPRSVHVERGPDGLIAIVQRGNGDVSTVPLPDDYDPNDDDGYALLVSLVPEELRGMVPRPIEEPEDDE
jgi:hypothetical protein